MHTNPLPLHRVRAQHKGHALAHDHAKAELVVVRLLLHLRAELQLRAGIQCGIQVRTDDPRAVQAQLDLGLLKDVFSGHAHLWCRNNSAEQACKRCSQLVYNGYCGYRKHTAEQRASQHHNIQMYRRDGSQIKRGKDCLQSVVGQR
jgi:hypothetical protein